MCENALYITLGSLTRRAISKGRVVNDLRNEQRDDDDSDGAGVD